jgi:tetratricopeptide (TPR) repeat protein
MFSMFLCGYKNNQKSLSNTYISINMKKYLLLSCLIFAVFTVFGQGKNSVVIPKDGGANDMVSLGKRYMKNKNYAQAVRMFEDALSRPYNQSTTAATYLSGLNYYYMGDMLNAKVYFNQIISDYPLSKYTDESKYHLALIKIGEKDENLQAEGLLSLINLSDNAIDGMLAMECKKAYKHYVFEQTPSTVSKKVFDKTPEKYKLEILEGLCYKMVQENKKAEAKVIRDEYVKKGGKSNEFLTVLLADKKQVPKATERDIVKIAIMLPLFVDNVMVDTLKSVPNRSQVALEIYEGFQKAVEEYAPRSKKKIYVKVFDTQRNSDIVSKQLQDMEDLYPDVVIGEIYNRQSRLISDWVEQKKIPQLIPISPTSSLVQGKQNVFLMRPSAAVHGRKMAEYAYGKGIRSMAIWDDKKASTKEIIDAFESTFKGLGGTTEVIPLDSIYIRCAGQISYWCDRIKTQGMYVPIADPQTVTDIFACAYTKNVKMFAHPEIENIAVETEQKSKLSTTFTSSFYTAENSTEYGNFFRDFQTKYNIPPSDNNVRGYDMGMYILQLLDELPKGTNLSDYIRNHESFNALHLDYQFQKFQENQSIHIMQYSGGGIKKVN